RRHTISKRDWSSDVCSSDLGQLNAALQAGRDSVAGAVAAGHHLYLCGEMGIGNTSAASALACALLGSPVVSMVGTGTGLDEAGRSEERRVGREGGSWCVGVP